MTVELSQPAPAARRAARTRRGGGGARSFLGGSAPLLVVAVAISVQCGAAIATHLFAGLGPLGALWLRSSFAVVLLLPVAWRQLARLGRREWRGVLVLGVVLAMMNACFFEAIARAPLGAVATIEFLGPLAVALAGSRGGLELAAVGLAAVGVALLGAPGSGVGGAGLGFALAAAACWAAYLVLAQRLVARVDLLAAVTGALAVGAVCFLPAAVLDGGELGHPSLLGRGLAVGLLSSALPYVLELVALKLVAASTYSVFLSLEPAVAAAVGLLVLGQRLRPLGIVAVACVVVASAATSRRAKMPPPGV